MLSNYKTVNSINTYSIVPPCLTLAITPTKVLKKKCKTRGRTHIETINQAQSDTTASTRFLSAALHSVSQATTHAHTDKIALYNNTDTSCFAESGASYYMFTDYSTFNTCHRLSNRYATLGYNTRNPIEGICTTVYTLNGHTILTCNTLHIPALLGPIYSLRKHHQRPGCGVYSSYKDGSYLFFPAFILKVE